MPMIEKHQLPTFADVAELIVRNGNSTWLAAQLEWWAQGVRYDRNFDEAQLTKADARKRLEAFANAARLMESDLKDPAIRHLLVNAGRTGELAVSTRAIGDLASRAELSFSSKRLASGEQAKRGRGKAKIPGLFDARTLVAARIVEMWRFFRGEVPGIGNLEAAAAAHAYWLACGGRHKGYGDPLNGWYDYFKTVRYHDGDKGLKQLIWRLDLEHARRRGGPPWFLGTYFPSQEVRI